MALPPSPIRPYRFPVALYRATVGGEAIQVPVTRKPHYTAEDLRSEAVKYVSALTGYSLAEAGALVSREPITDIVREGAGLQSQSHVPKDYEPAVVLIEAPFKTPGEAEAHFHKAYPKRSPTSDYAVRHEAPQQEPVSQEERDESAKLTMLLAAAREPGAEDFVAFTDYKVPSQSSPKGSWAVRDWPYVKKLNFITLYDKAQARAWRLVHKPNGGTYSELMPRVRLAKAVDAYYNRLYRTIVRAAKAQARPYRLKLDAQ